MGHTPKTAAVTQEAASQRSSKSTTPEGGRAAQRPPGSLRGAGALQQETQAIPAATQGLHLMQQCQVEGAQKVSSPPFMGEEAGSERYLGLPASLAVS